MRALGGSVNAISLVSVSSLPCPVFVWSEAKTDEVKMEHAMPAAPAGRFGLPADR